MTQEPKKPKKQVHWSKGTLTPESRTMRYLASRGWDCWITEQRLQWRRIDLFNAFDLVAQREYRIIGVQATTNNNIADRQTKLGGNPHVDTWCTHSRAFLFAWSTPAKKGGLWLPKIRVRERGSAGWYELITAEDRDGHLGLHAVHEVDE